MRITRTTLLFTTGSVPEFLFSVLFIVTMLVAFGVFGNSALAEDSVSNDGQVGEDTRKIIRKGSDRNENRYIKLDGRGQDLPDSASSWVMVKDNVTGLIWEVKTDDGTIHDRDNTYTWKRANDVLIAELNLVGFGGYADWRLPTIKELASIVDKESSFPAINVNYFPETIPSYYWSGTTFKNYTDVARVINFGHGLAYDYPKSKRYFIRGVRSGQ